MTNSYNDNSDDWEDKGDDYNGERKPLKVAIKSYINHMRNVEINDKFYENISGSFRIGHPNKDTITVKLQMNSPETEYMVGEILIGNKNKFDKYRLGALTNIFDSALVSLYPIIRTSYLKNIKYLKNLKYFGVKLIPSSKFLLKDISKITNLIINSKRKIKTLHINTEAYKKLLRERKLRKVEYKLLSKYETKEYEIDEGNTCVPSFLMTIPGCKKIIKNLNIEGKELDTKEIIEIAKDINIGIMAYDIDGLLIDEYYPETKPKRIIKYIIYDDHFYVLEGKPNKINNNKVTMVKNMKQKKIKNIVKNIKSTRGERYIIDNLETWKEIIEEIKKENLLIDYSSEHLIYKGNRIEYNESYEDSIKIVQLVEESENGGKCKTKHLAIDKILKLRGVLNRDVFRIFDNQEKIRVFTKHDLNESDKEKEKEAYTLILDVNKAYQSQLFNNNHYPIPTIDDHIEKYDKEIKLHGFYYCELNEYDDLLAPVNDYYYAPIVQQLIKDKRIKKITHQFVTKKFKTLDINDLELENIEFPLSDLRTYIGWLRKSTSIEEKKYDLNQKNDDMENKDLTGLQLKYGVQCTYNEKNEEAIVTRHFTPIYTGLLVNTLIVEMTNLKLYLMNKKMKELNPRIFLNRVRTDALWYINDKKCELPENISKQIGDFKISQQTKNYRYINDDIKIETPYSSLPTIIKDKVNFYEMKSTDGINNKILKKILTNRESLQIQGRPGYGKSHLMIHEIIPFFEKEKINYFLTSSTIENSNENEEKKKQEMDIKNEFTTINSVFKGLSEYEMKRKFKKTSYIVIDESSQLTQSTYKVLEFIKNECNVSFILIGDPNQCKSVDADEKSWINTKFVYRLCDNNVITLQKHDLVRCDKQIDKLLDEIIELENFDDIKQLVYKKLNKGYKNTKNEVNICYLHKTINKISDDYDLKGKTIHSYQGKTIVEDYSIWDFNRIHDRDLFYTAISRAKKFDQITLIVNKDDCEEYGKNI